MRYLSAVFAGLLLASATLPHQAGAQDPVIQAVVDNVNIDSLIWHLERLTGEEAVDVGGGPQFITSRHKLNAGNALAAQWLQQQLNGLGYAPFVQPFNAGTGENVYGVKYGMSHPGRKVIVCGHYDAMPGGPVAAPAADDDGSGTVAVLEAARVFAPLAFENTVVFALWDEEEQGLVGSDYYAGVAAANDDTILAVINMDAIAFDSDGDDLMRIHTKPIANSIAIKDSALMVNSTYGINLPIAVNNPGATYSDHASFWSEGYGAILVIEDFDNDGNPHYHTPTDLIQYLDLPYFERLAQLGIATTAVWADPYGSGTEVPSIAASRPLLRVYPNPSSTAASALIDLPVAQRCEIYLTDALGRTVAVMHEGPLAAGEQAFTLPLDRLSPGSYRLVLRIETGSIASMSVVRTP